jgi:hypothetical protein
MRVARMSVYHPPSTFTPIGGDVGVGVKRAIGRGSNDEC